MTAWWTPEARAEAVAAQVAARTGGPAPGLVDASAAGFVRAVRDRIPGFTPDWTDLRRDDPGVVLTSLLGDLFRPVLERVNRLPEVLLAQELRIAGVDLAAGTAARTVLQLQVVPTAPAPVLVVSGFQAAAPAADGQGRVVFETERDVVVTPARVREVHTQIRRASAPSDARGLAADTARVLPFGDRPQPGAALWLGLDTPVGPSPSLSLQVVIAGSPGAPPAASRGGTGVPAAQPPPVLRWDVLVGSRPVPAAVVLDETGGLRQTGIVELAVPPGWEPVLAPQLRSRAALRWLRIELIHGSYRQPPVLAAIRLNAVTATAARTVAGEIPERVSPAGEPRTRLRLRQTPVLPDSVVLEVDETATDAFGLDPTGGPRRWSRVASLAGQDPDGRVFTLDPGEGILTFGDGVTGAALPDGFRNVRVLRYRTGGGPAGAIAAGTTLSAVTAVPFVIGAVSPDAATGGTGPEPLEAALRRGPLQIRSRGRAVTLADYELLACQAPGAQIARAHAATGFHPEIPGAPVPGLVGVLVVPVRRGTGPPVPGAGELDSVARFLVDRVCPAGVQVVVGPPRYEQIRVEGRLVIAPGVDLGVVVHDTIAAVDRYLDPLCGGDDGQGWVFGAPVRHAALLRRLLDVVPGLRAVPALTLVADGRRLGPCTDHALAPHALPFPATHELVPIADGGGPR